RLDVGVVALGDGPGRLADLPLTGQEHEDVARSLPTELIDGVDDGLHLVPVVVDDVVALLGPVTVEIVVLATRPAAGTAAAGYLDQLAEGPVADLNRVGAALDQHDG